MHEEPRNAWATFDRWAGNLLILLGALAVVAMLLVVSATSGTLAAAPVLVATGVTIGLLVVMMLGLRDGRSWARPATVALLYAMIAIGIVEVVSGLALQRITFPIAAILAVAVLSRRPASRPEVGDHDRLVALVVAVVYLLAALPGPLSPFLGRAPAFLMAGEDDLLLGISTNCADAARITPGMDRPVVLVTWLWTGDDALPGGQDAIQVEWDGRAPVTVASDDLVVPDGLADDPSGPAALALDAALDGSSAFIRYGMEGSSPAARQGALRVPFEWYDDRRRVPFEVAVRWAHDEAWSQRVTTMCEPGPAAGG